MLVFGWFGVRFGWFDVCCCVLLGRVVLWFGLHCGMLWCVCVMCVVVV